MKKVMIYCDRHNGEHPAITTVWLKAAGMPRIAKIDVCAEAFSQIMGTDSQNGATPPAPVKKTGRPSRGGLGADKDSVRGRILARLRKYIAKNRPFSLIDATAACKDIKTKDLRAQVGTVAAHLVATGELERLTQGLFAARGLKRPEIPADPAAQDDAMLKYLKTHPGTLSRHLAALVGMSQSDALATARRLRTHGHVRIKGVRGTTTYFAT